jgi:hypothetical protein
VAVEGHQVTEKRCLKFFWFEKVFGNFRY